MNGDDRAVQPARSSGDEPEELAAFEDETAVIPLPQRTTLVGGHERELRQDRRVRLVVLAGGSVGKLHVLNLGVTMIGRDDDCNIQILDAGTSRHHAVVCYDQTKQRYELRDLGSRNGTAVNGEPVEGQVVLHRGDKIQVGLDSVLRVSFGDEVETDYARKMYDAVLRDGLTGVYNRRYLEERLAGELAFTRRHQTVLSIVLFDIDHFKRVNDDHGHPAGDAVLRQLATRVAQAIRTEDVLARYGGEEFAVLGRDIDEERAGQLAERLRQLVDGAPFRLPACELRVSISLGVAEALRCGASDPKALVKAADEALYRAKDTGRNKVVRASELARVIPITAGIRGLSNGDGQGSP